MLEGKPSRTAQGVAAARASMRRPSTATGDTAADERLSIELARGIPPPHGLLYEYLVGRTRFFDDMTLAAIDRGTAQVVIVAAGYDGRALRFRSHGVQFVELDHPATQGDKRGLLDELGVDASHIRFAAADFTIDDVGGALAGAGHDATVSTLYLVEGLSVYLDEGVLRALLSTLRQRAADGSELAIDMSLKPTTAGRQLAKVAFDRRLAAVGEQARTRYEREAALAVLADCGWEPTDVFDPADLERRARRGSAILVRAASSGGPGRP